MCAGKGVHSGSSGQANAECVLGQRTVPPYPFCLTPDYSPDASPGTCASADATACQAVPWLTACQKLTKAPTLDAKSHVLSMQFPAPAVSGTVTVRLAYSTDGALCEFVRAPLMVQGTTLKLDLSQYYNDSCVLSIEVTVVTVVDACGNSMTITTMPSEPGGPGPFGIPIDKASGTAIGGGSCNWA
jgi:hypothetical protein